jgi:hypothetical protein
MFVFLVLLMIILKLLYGPIDKNPVFGEYRGENLIVKNKSDRVLDEIWVGTMTIDVYEMHYFRMFTFYDITGDGFNELIYIVWGQPENDQVAMIQCKSIRQNKILWSKSIQKKIDFPRKPYIDSEFYNINSIIAGDFDGSGRVAVFALARHPTFFPSLLVKLDALTGQELDHYVHAGGLGHIEAIDLDNNGIKELIITGINNAYEMASVTVMDPRFISGHSPLQGDYLITGYAPASEYAYILIPRTKVGQLYKYREKYNRINRISIYPETARIRFDIVDSNYNLGRLDFTSGIQIYMYMDYDLNFLSVGTGDNYDLNARYLVEAGLMDSEPDFEYFREYLRTVRYWDGYDWQSVCRYE